MQPTLHLTNWSSRKLHGPGHKLTIMAQPRTWEHGDGYVPVAVPTGTLLHTMRAALIERNAGRSEGAAERYQAAFEKFWRGAEFNDLLRPRNLGWAHTGVLGATEEVRDGDTLCCACARGAPCHRRWFAPFLVRAGWRVVLDGVEV